MVPTEPWMPERTRNNLKYSSHSAWQRLECQRTHETTVNTDFAAQGKTLDAIAHAKLPQYSFSTQCEALDARSTWNYLKCSLHRTVQHLECASARETTVEPVSAA